MNIAKCNMMMIFDSIERDGRRISGSRFRCIFPRGHRTVHNVLLRA